MCICQSQLHKKAHVAVCIDKSYHLYFTLQWEKSFTGSHFIKIFTQRLWSFEINQSPQRTDAVITFCRQLHGLAIVLGIGFKIRIDYRRVLAIRLSILNRFSDPMSHGMTMQAHRAAHIGMLYIIGKVFFWCKWTCNHNRCTSHFEQLALLWMKI